MEKVLGLDLGNCMICAVTEINGEMKYGHIDSVYDNSVISSEAAGVITIDNKSIGLGAGTISLMNVDKTKREFLKHQILWAVNELYGSKKGETHYIKLGVGVPINFYKEEKEEVAKYEEMIKNFKTFTGTIGKNEVSVNIVNAKVYPEGHAAIKAIAHLFKKNGTVMIIDVGMKTTDVILIKMVNGKVAGIVDSNTVDVCLQSLYEAMQKVISRETGIKNMPFDEIDMILKTDDTIITGKKGSIDLKEALTDEDVMAVAVELFKQLDNKFGEIYRHQLAFIGGGSELFIKALDKLKDEYLINNLEVPRPLRYYANATGYMLNAKVLK